MYASHGHMSLHHRDTLHSIISTSIFVFHIIRDHDDLSNLTRQPGRISHSLDPDTVLTGHGPWLLQQQCVGKGIQLSGKALFESLREGMLKLGLVEPVTVGQRGVVGVLVPDRHHAAVSKDLAALVVSIGCRAAHEQRHDRACHKQVSKQVGK